MSYTKDHKSSQCDKCLEDVGLQNLYRVPFLYCDMNDHIHKDASWMVGLPDGAGYRQYYECKKCYKKEIKIIKKQQRIKNGKE